MCSLCFRVAGNTLLKLVYGYTATDKEDRLVKLVDEVMRQFSEMFVTNGFLVDFFPVREFHLRHAIYNNFPMGPCLSPTRTRMATWCCVEEEGAQVQKIII